MLLATASSALLAASALAVYLLLRRAAAERKAFRDLAHEIKGELDGRLAALRELILLARREADRLEAAVKNSESLELAAPHETLAALEDLADLASLANPDALGQAADLLPKLPGGVAGDLFDSERTALDIARLINQGLAAGEIARRLNLPIGEVELRLSMRAA